MNTEFLGVDARSWLWAGGVLVATFVAVRFLFGILAAYARRLAKRTETDADDLIAELVQKTAFLFVLMIAIWAASRSLDLTDEVSRGFTRFLTLGFILQGGMWATGIVQYLIRRFARERLDDDPSVASALGAVRVVASMVIWIVVVLTALATFDVNVSALVAGLGVGGIAIALAVQNILSDLFGAVTILLDKPFQVGDYIVVGDNEGTVEHIGLKTTRLQALTGEQLVIGNSDLLSSRIHNYKRMDERRASFSIGVEYGTDLSLVRQIPDMIRETIERHPGVRFDRAHFKSFGDSALEFAAVYWLTSPAYAEYIKTQQAINLELYERFGRDGIEFAFPSRTVYVKSAQSGTVEPGATRTEPPSGDPDLGVLVEREE